MVKTKIAVLVSGGGTNLQALLDAQREGGLPDGEIVRVISSNDSAYALTRAAQAGVPAVVCSRKALGSQAAFEAAISQALSDHGVELLVLAGFMSILSADFTSRWPRRILNVHPSLIPAFCGKGFYGLKVHQAALDYGVKVTGATVHFVNEVPDGGEILLQNRQLITAVRGEQSGNAGGPVGPIRFKFPGPQRLLHGKAPFQEGPDGVRLVPVGDNESPSHLTNGVIDNETGVSQLGRVVGLGTESIGLLDENPVPAVFAAAHDEIRRHRLFSVGCVSQHNPSSRVGIGGQQGRQVVGFIDVHWSFSLLISPDGSYKLSILKSADAEGSACARYTFEYPALAGVGHFLHTYVCDGTPIPTFQGEPERVTISGTMEEFAHGIWDHLNQENKISLYVRFTDLASGTYQEIILNKNQ